MIGLSIVGFLLVLALAYTALWYKNRMDIMISYSKFQEEWISDIIGVLRRNGDDEDMLELEELVAEKEARESPLV